MGCFYVNYTLRGPSQREVAAFLAGRKVFVSTRQHDCVVFDEESDKQDQKLIARLALDLSTKLHCAVLAVLIHDDDIFWYQLCEDGSLRDQYNSTPAYFNPSAGQQPPKGGDAEKICAAFDSKNLDEVEQILRKPQFGDGGYVFASERHADLARALGLPVFAVYGCYRGIVRGHYPKGITKEDMISSIE